MNKELIGLVAGLLIVASAIPYVIGAYRRTIHPNLVSWGLWALIGLALLLTYKSSGAKANIWPAVFGFINPVLIALVVWRRQYDRKPLDYVEKWCLAISLASLVLWVFVRKDESLAQWALYLALAADACAAWPTIKGVWKTPESDRPLAWGLFSLGSVLNLLAISDNIVSNYVYPIYMCFGSFGVFIPLVLYRIRKRVPIIEWA